MNQYQRVLIFLAGILAGYGLAHLPASALVTPAVATFFSIVGGLVMIVFSLTIVFLATKSLFQMFRDGV